MNLVTPEYAEKRGWKHYPLEELVLPPSFKSFPPISGVGGCSTDGAVGYVIFNVQVEGIPSYNENQVAIVMPDDSSFSKRVPVVLGTCTVHRVVNVMKESEAKTAPLAWQNVKVAKEIKDEFFCRRAMADDTTYPTNTGMDPLDLDEKLVLKEKFTVPGFQTMIVHARTQRTMMMGTKLHVMIQAPYEEDEASLPAGLRVLRTYDELKDGSRNVSLVVRNDTSRDIYVPIGKQIGRVVAANLVPEATPSPELLKEVGADNPEQPSGMTTEQRQRLLIETLEKDGGLGALKHWSKDTALKARRLLQEFHHIFSLESGEMGCTNATEHVIELMPGQEEPFKERFRRIAPPLVDEVRQHIQEMLDGGAIRPSQSAWCNAIVLVRKKDGTLRFCIDFRRLNARTKKDAYPLPRIQETMESLTGACHFSCMDLKSGFWQVRMAKESQQYTAFTAGSMGVYEFLRMPYGLCNAPATFQRLMQNCLGELNLTYALIYLDDVIVYSRTEDEHLTRLRAVFERMHENGLKLKPSKCSFFKEEIGYLGHRVSKEGILPGTENLKGIAAMAPPSTYTEIRKFLGATGWFRKFIKGYSRIAKPLNDLIAEDGSKMKNQPVKLSPEALVAFEQLKLKCISAPVLILANFSEPFMLETDASSDGLGAVLSQKAPDGKYHPVAYASRTLKGGEVNYHSSKLEFLALKWAVTNQFQEYLQYLPFRVRTDNNPLTYVMSTPNLDATGHRWVAALANYNMTIEYLKGSDNKVADVLSRLTETLDNDAVRELLERAKHSDAPRAETDSPSLVRKYEQDQLEVEDVLVHMRAVLAAKRIPKNLSDAKWVKLQRIDPVLRHVVRWVNRPREEKRTLYEYLEGVTSDSVRRAYAAVQKDLVIRRELLYVRTTAHHSQETLYLFIVPAKKRQVAIDLCHSDTGHQGRDRSWYLLRERFWWPGCKTQLLHTLRGCARCKLWDGKDPKAPMITIAATEPMDLLHIDHVGMEVPCPLNSRKVVVKKVLVVVDHFSRFVQAFVVPDEQAETTAKCLYDNYFRHYGFPRRLMSDSAPQLVGTVIQSLCNYLDIHKVRTTAFHPQSNGSVERVHQTLMRMIGKLDSSRHKNWPEHIGSVCYAYNATRSQISGYSPYYLMYGRRPRLPVDLLFPTSRKLPVVAGVADYVTALYERLREAVRNAKAISAQEARRYKRNYDKRCGAVELRAGDKVLVRADAYTGQRRKLKNRWGSVLWTVERPVAEGIPTYIVKNDSTGDVETLHRARLLLWISEDEVEEGIRSNLAMIANASPSHIRGSGFPEGKEESVVSRARLNYGLDLAGLDPMIDDPELNTDFTVHVALLGTPPMREGHMEVTDKGTAPTEGFLDGRGDVPP